MAKWCSDMADNKVYISIDSKLYGEKHGKFYRADMLIEDLVRFSNKETSCEGIFV